MKKVIKDLYNQSEFNKHDKKQQQLINALRKIIELAENEATTTIDGVCYPTSNIWRDGALIALELADISEWFDRYYDKKCGK